MLLTKPGNKTLDCQQPFSAARKLMSDQTTVTKKYRTQHMIDVWFLPISLWYPLILSKQTESETLHSTGPVEDPF
jgi:hypothetical protein